MYQKSLTGFFTAIAIYCLSLPPHGEAGLNHFSRGPFDEQGIQLVSVSRSPFDEQGIQIVSMSRNPFDEQGIQIVSIDRDPFNEQGVQIVSIDRDPFDEWGIQIISIEKSPCTKQGMQMIAGLLPRLKILPSILGDEENCFKAGIFQNQAEEDADASAEGEAEGEQDEDYLSQIEVRTTDIPDDLREDVLQLEEDLKIKMYQTDELYRKLTGTNNHIAQLEGRMKAREKKLPPWLAKLLLGDHLLIDEYRRYKKHRDELQKSLEKSQREDWLADRAIRQTISEWLNKRDQQFAELNDIMKSFKRFELPGKRLLGKNKPSDPRTILSLASDWLQPNWQCICSHISTSRSRT